MRIASSLVLLGTIALAAQGVPAHPQDDAPAGVAAIQQDAEAVANLFKTDLARAYLKTASALPPREPRTVYFDPEARAYLSEADAANRDDEARAKLTAIKLDETFYYTTRYGSPVAYARPLEIVSDSGLTTLAGTKVLDFGCGGIGPPWMMAALGADVTGVDIDTLLTFLYEEPGDLGTVKGPDAEGRVSLAIGRYPADPDIAAKVGQGYDLILSKNTLKRGFVHPESGLAFVDLGMDDPSFLRGLHDALKPGGLVLIYNLSPAPSPPGQPYKPMADGHSPFPREAWEAAGFTLEAFDQDDTRAARSLARALKWDQPPLRMDLDNDLFGTYTLARKPPARE